MESLCRGESFPLITLWYLNLQDEVSTDKKPLIVNPPALKASRSVSGEVAPQVVSPITIPFGNVRMAITTASDNEAETLSAKTIIGSFIAFEFGAGLTNASIQGV